MMLQTGSLLWARGTNVWFPFVHTSPPAGGGGDAELSRSRMSTCYLRPIQSWIATVDDAAYAQDTTYVTVRQIESLDPLSLMEK